MLHAPSSSIENKASWVVASVALVIMLMSFGAAWIGAVALKDIAAEVGGTRSIPAFASALDCDLRRADDRIGPHHLDARPALAIMDRPRPVHRPDRARRHQRADVHLC